MGIALGVVAVIVIIALIFFFTKKSNSASSATELEGRSDSTAPKGATATTASSADTHVTSSLDDSGDIAQAEETDQTSDSDADSKSEKESEETAEGVRLDETAEQTAAQNLKAARRERKLQKLRQGLSKTRGGLVSKISELFKGKKEIDASLLEELEEVLITSDVGAKTTEWLLEMIRSALDKEELKDSDAVWALLKQEIKHALKIKASPWNFDSDKPFTIMVVGVNGAGKTTTIGKLASQFTEDGHKVVLAAADTFRAAAVNQLEIWGRRTDSEVVKPAKEGADPSSVVFDAIKKAQETGADIVIADTAGRLHTQAPLMEELKKINRVMGKAHENAPHEILLVLDATNGQNALQQVKEFGEALSISGIALTKLDGTAKGGVIIGICHEYKIPVRYIGIGEAKDSLRQFDVDDFVDALFIQENEQEMK
ncbi:MAG: signal recognition particle-docking protein FtsY [Deltaproteobacteria bacterium]|nr:signal recognition particle-docking protein FtsY [Deltaproteobacteria bacterium]